MDKTISTPHKPGVDSLLLTLLGFLHLYRYPSFFYPRVKTFIDYMSPRFKQLIGNPVQDVVPNPVSRLLVTLGVALIIGYLLVDLFNHSKNRNRYKIGLFCLIIMHSVSLPVMYETYRYHVTGDQLYGHDGGVIQTSLALEYLLEGRNPYSEDYTDTIMNDGFDPNDPPLFHFPYLPVILWIGLPLKLITQYIFNWFDARFIYLSCYLLCFPLLWRMARGIETRLSLCVIFGLNPLLTQFLVQGRNDIVCLYFIVLSIYLLGIKRSEGASLAALSMACATKPFAWFFVPFIWLYLQPVSFVELTSRGRGKHVIRLIFRFFPLWFPWILLVGPFLIWDFHALWDDIYLFNAGQSEINYAFGGTPGVGFPNVILYFGWIETLQDYFPLWPFQLTAVAILFWITLRFQSQRNTLKNGVLFYGLILMIYLFFARLFHDNYLGFLIGIFAIGYLGDRLDGGTDFESE
jgi:hypothetical protein